MTSSASQSSNRTFKARLRIPLLIGLIIAAVGLIAPEIDDFIKDNKAQQWTTVPAKLTKVELPITVWLKDPYFSPQIEYQYSFDSKQYTGKRLSFTKYSPMLGYDMGIFQKAHEVGQYFDARVEPNNPSNSVLKPNANLASVFGRFLAIVMACTLIYFSTYPKVRH